MIFKVLYSGVIGNVLESFVDNVFRDMVEPKIGSIVYCELALGQAEHSGVYIGDNQIVHLDGSGFIEIVSPNKFMNRLGGWNTAISIYVSCCDSYAVGSEAIAKRAKEKVGSIRDYSLLLDNCHQFTAGCITGDFENRDNFLWMLKDTAKLKMSANTWRVWDTDDE